jgi:transcriptional regulator with XRE-family HTH domain
MNRFGQLLKEARKESRKKLRDVAEATGLSISYLSDIENGRKKAPSLDIVKTIEGMLCTGGRLLKAAQSEMKIGIDFKSIINRRPELSLGLLRVTEGMSDEELSSLINEIQDEKGGTSR